jgi:hypothetical protein
MTIWSLRLRLRLRLTCGAVPFIHRVSFDGSNFNFTILFTPLCLTKLLSTYWSKSMHYSAQFWTNLPAIAFSWKSSSGSRVVPCGRTDRHDATNSRFPQFTNAPRKYLDVPYNYGLPVCDAMSSIWRVITFRINMLPPSSGTGCSFSHPLLPWRWRQKFTPKTMVAVPIY